jgi:hypothetical protein
MSMFKGRTAFLALWLVAFPLGHAHAQTKWYKFSKVFIDKTFSADSAMGQLTASSWAPAGKPHAIACGGDDGELHVGVPGDGIVAPVHVGGPVSALADDNSDDFGVVAEPPNATAALRKTIAQGTGEITFNGYYRTWNEGHDVGRAFPSNPHHVLELHPAWSFQLGGEMFGSPTTVHSMQGYHGYGVSKYGPLLQSIGKNQWLRVAEDDDYVYVQLQKADNFYQLPVIVKQARPVSHGKEILVDVYSEGTQRRKVYSNLTVVVADGTRIATTIKPGPTFLLGFFSVNLRKAMSAASGHRGPDASIFAPGTLEFFAFGVPLGQSVPKSSACQDLEDDT